jgi:hypothetical protein
MILDAGEKLVGIIAKSQCPDSASQTQPLSVGTSHIERLEFRPVETHLMTVTIRDDESHRECLKLRGQAHVICNEDFFAHPGYLIAVQELRSTEIIQA